MSIDEIDEPSLSLLTGVNLKLEKRCINCKIEKARTACSQKFVGRQIYDDLSLS